jgi:hypothetical protein
MMTVATTGERKSACDHHALARHREHEQELRQKHAEDRANWER